MVIMPGDASRSWIGAGKLGRLAAGRRVTMVLLQSLPCHLRSRARHETAPR